MATELAKQGTKSAVRVVKVAKVPEDFEKTLAALKAEKAQHETDHNAGGVCDATCAEARDIRLKIKAANGRKRRAESTKSAPVEESAAEAPAIPADLPKVIDLGDGDQILATVTPIRKTPPKERTGAEVKAEVDAKAPRLAAKAAKVNAEIASTVVEAEDPAERSAAAPKATKATKETALEKATKAVKPIAPIAARQFLMYVGSSFYTKEDFIEEAKTQGVSKRMPTFRISPDLQVGKSVIWLAAAGKRTAAAAGAKETEPGAMIFGYFIPDAVEFIAGEDGDKTFAEIIAHMKTVEGGQVIKGDPALLFAERKCGVRKVGGTYLTTTKGKASPLVLLDAEVPYFGNHFRGMMRLSDASVADLTAGKPLTTLLTDRCMSCNEEILVAPDSAKRAAVERRRIARGEEAKWILDCAGCKTKKREEEKAAKVAAAAEAPAAAEGEEAATEE